jgi:hypothetical protein
MLKVNASKANSDQADIEIAISCQNKNSISQAG